MRIFVILFVFLAPVSLSFSGNLVENNPEDQNISLEFYILPIPNPNRVVSRRTVLEPSAPAIVEPKKKRKPVALPAPTQGEIAACDSMLNGALIGERRLKPLVGKGACGSDPVYDISGVITKSGKVTFPKPLPFNCLMLGGLKDWVSAVQTSSNQLLGEPLTEIAAFSSYVCRNRYNDPTARISQHAFANASDMSAVKTKNGSQISVLSDWDGDLKSPNTVFVQKAHALACDTFSTVLGPNSNAAHEDHFHLDMGRGGPRARYKVCE